MARGRRLGAAEQSLASRISAGRRGHQCVGVSGLLVNRVCETNRVVGGPLTPVLLQAPQSAYRIGCLAAAPPTRRAGRLRREDLTRPEASSTPHVERARREAPSGVARPYRSLPSKGTGSALESGECAVHRRWRPSQGVCGEKPPHAQTLPVCARPIQCASGEKQERQGKKKVLQRA